MFTVKTMANAARLATLPLILSLMACSTFKPVALDYQQIDLHKPEKTMDFGVYTPPGWSSEEKLPLILFLHGGGDSHTSFEKFGAHQYFDEQIRLNKMPRVIVVTPNGDRGFWENWYDGSHRYRDWILQDLLPQVQKQYNTLACPEHCHLAGISMGGFGALRFAFFAEDRFSSVSAISAPILSEAESDQAKSSLFIRLFFPLKRIFGPNLSENYAETSIERVWLRDEATQKVRLQLIWGDQDTELILKGNERFQRLLEDNDISHDYHVYKGGHKWKFWIPQFNRVVNFLVKQPQIEVASKVSEEPPA